MSLTLSTEDSLIETSSTLPYESNTLCKSSSVTKPSNYNHQTLATVSINYKISLFYPGCNESHIYGVNDGLIYWVL